MSRANGKDALKSKLGAKNGHSGGDAKRISVTCTTRDHLPFGQIQEFQGELKTLNKAEFEKLKQSIIRYGLSFPSFVWKTKAGNKCLDGHQRGRVLAEMAKEGWQIPPVPVVYVDAKSEQEAREKVLLLSSQYGRYTMDSVYEYINASQLDFYKVKDVIDLPQFDLGKFEDFYYRDNVTPVSADEQSRLDQKNPVECPNCGHSFTPS